MNLKKLFTPSFSKILVFLSPLIYQSFFWFVATTRGGITPEAITNTIETVGTVLTFPGSLVCAAIPDCTKSAGDVFYTEPRLLALSHAVAYTAWYAIAALMGEFIEILYKKFTKIISSRVKINSKVLFALTVIGFILLVYLSAFLLYRAFWYKVSGGKNISFEKHECVNDHLKVYLKNVGFEEVGLDEIEVRADKKPITCRWEGDLSLGNSAVCTSVEPLGIVGAENLSNLHSIEVKDPISTTGTAVYCD